MAVAFRGTIFILLTSDWLFGQSAIDPAVQKEALSSIQRTQSYLLIGFAFVCVLALVGMVIALLADGPPSFQGALGGIGGAGGGWRISPALTLMLVAVAFATLLAAIGIYGVKSVSAFAAPPTPDDQTSKHHKNKKNTAADTGSAKTEKNK